jgi:multidrug efflux pump subunit AcrA (membrane-fusion protein)
MRDFSAMKSLKALLLFIAVTPVMAHPVTLPARAVSYRPETHAWAQVESIAPLVLRSTVPARVSSVHVTPGQVVSAGEPLVSLGGPQLDGELAAARARQRAAQGELTAARNTAASVARTYPLVTNRQTLEAAQSALAAAQSQLAAAQAALTTLRAQKTVSSPLAAVVNAVSVAPGADLSAGSPVVTLLPRGQLWLRAEYFDATPISSATKARFTPTSGDPAQAVRLVAELPARAANGARILDFAATSPATWQAGDTGDLVMSGPPRAAVAVPAGALILDAGKWYLLTDIGGKLARQPVIPGPAQGTDVVITAGLQAGVPVVVREAYLLYHHNFAAQYTPPD